MLHWCLTLAHSLPVADAGMHAPACGCPGKVLCYVINTSFMLINCYAAVHAPCWQPLAELVALEQCSTIEGPSPLDYNAHHTGPCLQAPVHFTIPAGLGFVTLACQQRHVWHAHMRNQATSQAACAVSARLMRCHNTAFGPCELACLNANCCIFCYINLFQPAATSFRTAYIQHDI